MAEGQDKESKTEEATEKRVRDAIDKGNVPTSREASTLASLAAIFVGAYYFLGGNVVRVQQSLARFIDQPGAWPLENAADAVNVLKTISVDAAILLLPLVLLVMIAGFGSSFLQNPPQLISDRITPDWSRVSPMKSLRRLFGAQGLVDFLKSLFKLAAVTLVGYLVLKAMRDDVIGAMYMEPVVIPELIRKAIVRIVGWVALLTLVLVVADLLWSRISWRQELRMTKQEVKDEHKQVEGDPQIKARIRAIGRARARQRMMTAVPRATIVVTNPTHYAVALRYVREEGGAPQVLAKGIDMLALKIREIAEAHGIPVIEDKPLARSLYEGVEVGKLIPPQFYKAVAEIIYYLHLRKKGR